MNQFESQLSEWKESWRDDHLRWVCGFASAEGGRLEIGRNDKGEIVGLADAPKLLEDLPNKIRDLLGILVVVNLHHTGGKPWIAIGVDAYPNPISYRGHYYIRSGTTLQELKRAALLLFHEDPERFVTGAFAKIGYFRSASDLAYHDEVHGNLFDQSAGTIDLVRTKYLKAAITYEGIRRIFEACENAGTPAPVIDYKPNDL